MSLAFNLFLILLIELPIVGFFFSKRKRRAAMLVALFVNLITWPVTNILRLDYTEWSPYLVQAVIISFEALGYYLFLGRNVKKAILMAVIANIVSFTATKFIKIEEDPPYKKVALPIAR